MQAYNDYQLNETHVYYKTNQNSWIIMMLKITHKIMTIKMKTNYVNKMIHMNVLKSMSIDRKNLICFLEMNWI